MGTTFTTRSNRLRRTAAAFGIMVVSGCSGLVGAAALAPEAGALPNCPWYNPYCVVTPTTRPPIFDPPGGGVLDPTVGDPVTPPTTTPPTTPPTTKPPTNTGGNGGNNGGSNGGQQATTGGGGTPAADTTADVPLDATPAAATTKPDDGGSDSTGLILGLVAGIALLGAAGTGLYLKYGRSHV